MHHLQAELTQNRHLIFQALRILKVCTPCTPWMAMGNYSRKDLFVQSGASHHWREHEGEHPLSVYPSHDA